MTATMSAKIAGKMSGKPNVIPNLYLPSGSVNPNAIRHYRSLHRLTQAEFARLVGASENSVAHWENGRSEPSPSNVDRIHQFVQATGVLIEKHGGVIPPNESFRRLVAEDGDSASPEALLLSQANDQIDRLKRTIGKLEQENERLRDRLRQASEALEGLPF